MSDQHAYADRHVYEVVRLDPPVPVTVLGYREHPLAWLMRWCRSRDGWSEGWTAIVRLYSSGAHPTVVEVGVPLDFLDDDPDARPFRLSRRYWTRRPERCTYCTVGPWMVENERKRPPIS